MTWQTNTEITTDRVLSIIKNVYKDRDVHEIVDHLIVNSEIIKRDFTKRQQKIILFIKILSFPMGKSSAIIPNMKDFQLCGIGITKVRDELEKLVQLQVLNWEVESNRFSIRQPNEWLVPYHQGYVESRAAEIFALNLRDAKDELEKKLNNE